jgi:hypothetical protein
MYRGFDKVSPKIGDFNKVQSSVNIPKSFIQLNDARYYSIGKKKVDTGKGMTLPDVSTFKQTPYDFVQGPKQTTAERWAHDFFKTKNMLEEREKRKEYMLSNANNEIMNRNILADADDSYSDILDEYFDAQEIEDMIFDDDKFEKSFRDLNTALGPVLGRSSPSLPASPKSVKSVNMDWERNRFKRNRALADLSSKSSSRSRKRIKEMVEEPLPVIPSRRKGDFISNISPKRIEGSKTLRGTKRKNDAPDLYFNKRQKLSVEEVAGKKRKGEKLESLSIKKKKKQHESSKRKADNNIGPKPTKKRQRISDKVEVKTDRTLKRIRRKNYKE